LHMAVCKCNRIDYSFKIPQMPYITMFLYDKVVSLAVSYPSTKLKRNPNCYNVLLTFFVGTVASRGTFRVPGTLFLVCTRVLGKKTDGLLELIFVSNSV
jgi:hypothetical protein